MTLVSMEAVFTASLHGQRLNMDILEREGCGFVGKHGADFMKCKDTWFRGLDLQYGPNGSVYVTDWTDTGECHNYDKADTSNGRIYRVTYGSPKPFRGDVLPKMAWLRDEIDRRGLDLPIGVDGGVNLETIREAHDAGGRVLVVGSGLYRHDGDLTPVVDELRRAALADAN